MLAADECAGRRGAYVSHYSPGFAAPVPFTVAILHGGEEREAETHGVHVREASMLRCYANTADASRAAL